MSRPFKHKFNDRPFKSQTDHENKKKQKNHVLVQLTFHLLNQTTDDDGRRQVNHKDECGWKKKNRR